MKKLLQHGMVRGFDITHSLGETLRTLVNQKGTGFQEWTDRGGITTMFAGNEAESRWERASDSSNTVHIAGTITCPEVKPDAMLTRHQADLFVGYGLHELAHMAFSDFAPFDAMAKTQGKQGVEIMNALEDARVEQAMSESPIAPNSRSLFNHIATSIYSHAQSNAESPYDPNDIGWLPVTLSLLGRERRGAHLPEARLIWSQLNERNSELIGEALKRMDAASLNVDGTWVAKDTADWLIKELNLPPQPQTPPKPKPQGQGGSGQGDPSKGEAGEGKGEGEEADGEGQGGKPEFDKDHHAEGKGGSGGSGHGSGTGWYEMDVQKQDFHSAKPEDAVSDAASQANKTGRGGYKLPHTETRDYEQKKTNTPGVYDELRKLLPANMGAMRHALWRLMHSRDEAHVDRYRESGRWDNRALSRMLCGSSSLYRQTKEVEGMRTCVSIILDLSGSMAGDNIQNAAAACIAFAECMEQLSGHGVVYEICGFEDFSPYNMAAGTAVNSFQTRFGASDSKARPLRQENIYKDIGTGKTTKSQRDARTRFDGTEGADWRARSFEKYNLFRNVTNGVATAGIVIFKGFGHRLATRRNHISAMIRMAMGGTPDSAGVIAAIKHVLSRPEPNKVVLVLTDGCGNDDEVRGACKFAESVGVDVIGVGIGDTSVKSVYPISVVAKSLSKLGEAAFSKVVEVVMKNRAANGQRITT